MAERRRHSRSNYSREINYSDGEFLYQGVIGNISVSGMFINTSACDRSDRLRSGMKIALYVGLPKHDNIVDGVVVRRGRAGIGVALSAMSTLDELTVQENNEMWG